MTPFEHEKCISLPAAALRMASDEVRAGDKEAFLHSIVVAVKNTDKLTAWRILKTLEAYTDPEERAFRLLRISADVKRGLAHV